MKTIFNKIFFISCMIFRYCINTEVLYKLDLEHNIHNINEKVLTKLHIFKIYNRNNKIHTMCAYFISVFIMSAIDAPIALYIKRPLDMINPTLLICALILVATLSCLKTFTSIKSNHEEFFKSYHENIKFVQFQFKIFMILSFAAVNFIAIIAMKLIFLCVEHPGRFNFQMDPNVSNNTICNLFYLLFGVIAAKYSTVILKAINEFKWYSRIIS